MNSSNDHLSLSSSESVQVVPQSFAEKAMASLMQLHTELMDEKERRVDLFRRLMEKEQAVAELKMYVKMLEEKMAAPAVRVPVAKPAEPAVSSAAVAPLTQNPGELPAHPPPPAVPFVARTAPSVRSSFAHLTRSSSRPMHDGWKTW